MKRLWILLLITIVTVLLPQKMLADIKLKNMFVWDQTYTSAWNEISSSTSGWAPGTYSIQLKLKNGWAGENCTLRIQKFEKKNRIVISQEYVVLKQLDKYWSQETFNNITFPSNTDNNGIGIYFQKVTKVDNKVAMIDASNCYATLKFDFDALRSQLTTLLDETKVYIDMLPASTKQTYTSQYNGLKTIVDALQNDAPNASEVYSYYTQYKLWLGVSENDLGKEIQNLKNGAMTAAYPAVVEEVRKTFKSADSLQIQTRKTVDSWLDVTSLSDPKKSCYDAIRSKAYSRLGDVYTEMVAIARDLTAFAGHGATSDQDYVKNTQKNLLYRISAQTTELTSILTAVTTRKKNVDDAVSKYDELINTKNEYEQNSVFNRLIDGKYQNLVSAWEAFVGAADAVKKKIEGADYDAMGTLDVTDLYNAAVEKKAALEKIFSEEKKKDETFSSYATNIEELRTYYNAWGSLTAEQKRYEAGKPLSDYVGTKYSNLESHLTGLKNALDEARATKPALTDLFFQGKDTEGSFSYKLAKAKEAIDAFFDQVKGLAQKYNSVMDAYNTARLDLATAKGLVEGRYIYANTQYNKDNYNYKTAIEDCESYHASFQSSVDAALNKKNDEHIAAINALAYDATKIAAIKARVTEEQVAEDLKGYMADMQVKFFADLSKISEYKGQILTGDEAADKQTYGLSYTDLKSTYDTIDKEIDVTTARKQYESGTDAERTALQNKVTEALKKWADLLVSASQTKAKVATNKTLYEQALSDLSAINWTADGAQKEIVDAAGAAYTQGTNGEKTAVDGSISQITADVNKLDSDIKSAYQKETMEADYASLSASLHAIKTAITTAKTSAQALNSNYAAYQDVLRRINSAKNSCETDIKNLDTSLAGDDYSALLAVSMTALQKYLASLDGLITSNENCYKNGKSVSEKLSFISSINRVQLYIQDAVTLTRNRKSRLSNSLTMLRELESKLNTIKTNYSVEYAAVTDEKTKVDTDISSIKTTISTANSGDCSGLDKLNVKDAYNTALTDIDKLLEACKVMRTDNEKAAAVSAARAKVSQLTTAFNTARNAVKQAYTTVGGSGYYTTIETGISSDIEALPAAIDAKEADPNVKSTDDFFKGADTPGSLEAQIAAITTRIKAYQTNAEEAAKNYLAVKNGYQQGGYAIVTAKGLVENLPVYTVADYNKDKYDYKSQIEDAEAYVRSIQTVLDEALKKTGDEHVTAMKALAYDSDKANAVAARVTQEQVAKDLEAYNKAYNDLLGKLDNIKDYKKQILTGDETADKTAYGMGYDAIKNTYNNIDKEIDEAEARNIFSNGTEAQRTALKETLTKTLANWANLLVTANNTKSKVATNKSTYEQTKGRLSAIEWTSSGEQKNIIDAAGEAYTKGTNGEKTAVDGSISRITADMTSLSNDIESSYQKETMAADNNNLLNRLSAIRTAISTAKTDAQALSGNYAAYMEVTASISSARDTYKSKVSDVESTLTGDTYKTLLTVSKAALEVKLSDLDAISTSNGNYYKANSAVANKASLNSRLNQFLTDIQGVNDQAHNRMSKLTASLTMLQELKSKLSTIQTSYSDEYAKATTEKTQVDTDINNITSTISTANSGDCSGLDNLDVTAAYTAALADIDKLLEACKAMRQEVGDKAEAVSAARAKVNQILMTLSQARDAVRRAYKDISGTDYYTDIENNLNNDVKALSTAVDSKEADPSVKSTDDFFKGADTPGSLEAQIAAITTRITTYQANAEAAAKNYLAVKSSYQQGGYAVVAGKALVERLPIYSIYDYNEGKYDYKTHIEEAEAYIRSIQTALDEALKKTGDEHVTAMKALVYDDTKASAITARVTEEKVKADMEAYLAVKKDINEVYDDIQSLQVQIISGNVETDRATFGIYYAELKEEYDNIIVPTKEEVDNIMNGGSSEARTELSKRLGGLRTALTALLVKASTWKSLNTLNELAKEYADGEIADLKWTERQKEIIEAAGDAYTKGSNDEKTSLDNLLGTIGTAIKTLQDDIDASYKKGTLAGDFQNGYSERLDNIRTSIVEADAFADAQKANYDAYRQVADKAATVRMAYEKAVSTLEKSLEGDAYATLLTAAKASLTGILASLNSIESDNKADYQAGNCATNSTTHLKKLQELNASISESVQQKTDWKANLDAANQSLKDLNDRLTDVESNYQDVLALCKTEHTAVMDAIQAMKAKVDKAYSGDCSGLEGFSLSTDYAAAVNALSTLTAALNSQRTGIKTKADAIVDARNRLEQLSTVWMNAKSTLADYRYGTAPALERYTAIPQGIDDAIKALETEVEGKEKDDKVTGTEPYFTGDADTEGSLAAKISAVVSDIDKFKTAVKTSVDKYDTYMAQVNEGLKTVAAAKAMVENLPIYTDFLNNDGQYRYKVTIDEAETDLQTQSAAAAEALTKKDQEHLDAITSLKYDGTKVDGIAARVTEEKVKADMEAYLAAEKDIYRGYNIILSLQTQILSGDETVDKATYGTYYAELKADYDKISVPTREEINEILADGSSEARDKLDADLAAASSALTALLVKASTWKSLNTLNEMAKEYADGEIAALKWTERQKEIIEAAGDAYTKGTNDEKNSLDNLLGTIGTAIKTLQDDIDASYKKGTLAGDFQNGYSERLDNIRTSIVEADAFADAQKANYDAYRQVADQAATVRTAYEKAVSTLEKSLEGDAYATLLTAAKALLTGMLTSLNSIDSDNKADYQAGNSATNSATHLKKLQELNASISESVQQKTDWKANLDAANQSLKDLNDRLADVESNYQDVLALCETEHTAVMDAIQAMKTKVDKAYSGDCSGLEGFSLSTDYAAAVNTLSTLTTALNSHRTDNQTKADAIENARDRLEQLGIAWTNAKSTLADYRYGTAPALERYTAIPQGIDDAIKALETEVEGKEKDDKVTGTEPYFTGDADTEGSLAAKISAVVSDIDKFKTTVVTSVDKYDTYMAQVNEGLKTVAAARTLVASLPIYTDYLNNKGQYRYKVALDEADKDLQTQSAAAAEALTKKDSEHQAAIDALKYDGTKVEGIADRVTEEQVKADMEVYQDEEEDLLGVYTSILSLQTQILSGDETADKATYGIYYDDLKADYDKIVVPTGEEINEILAGGSSSAREKLEADLEEINGELTTLLVRASKLKVQVQVNDATYSHVLSEIDGFEWTENGMQKSAIAAAGDAYTKGTNGEKAAVDSTIKAITDKIGSLTEAVKASHGQGTMYDDYTAKYKDQITAIHTDISNASIQAAALAANYKSYVAGNDRLAEVAADLKKAQTDAAAVDNADGYRAGTTFYAEKELAETMQTRLTEAGETLKARYEEGKAEEGQAEVTALLQQLDNDINNVPVRAQANFTAYKTLESLGYETSDIIFIVKSVLNSNDKSSKRDSLIAVLDTYQQKTDSAMTANLELYQNGQLEKQSQSETAIEGLKALRAQVEDLINNALINYAAQIEADNAAMLDRIKQEGATAKETMVTVKTTVTEYNEVMENVAGAAELKTIFYFMTLLDRVAPAEIEDILRTAQEDYDDVRASAEVDVFDADTLYYKSLKALDDLAKASIATFVELYRNDNDVNRYLLTQQTDSLQTLFDKVRAYIETYCPDVSKPYLLDTLPEIQALIDAAVAYVSEQYEQGALNGDSRIDFEEIAALLEEKRAHAEAEQREFGDFITNKTALDRLRGELDAIQKILDEVKEMLDLYKYDGIEDDDMEYARLQEALDRLSEELSERYKNHELDEHSTIDSERLRTDAVALRDKVLSKIPQTGIDGVGIDGNEVIYLDATGHRVEQPLKGQVIIIRQKNGVTRKVIWKQDGNE